MDDIRFMSSSSISKPVQSPSTGSIANLRQRTDSASVIQQADVSSSRPALLAHDALGPLLFEALDGFFFTINHNCELDFVSDNVGQYLKYSQEELAGRNLYHYVHPSDVGEFSKIWTKKDAGDSLTSHTHGEQSRGRTFLCRMRRNDESTPYITMVISVALHRDSSGNDKTFLICIARRPPLNEFKDKPAVLGFDQFSSRINRQYDIESLDASHMKCEALDTNFRGRNFREYVHTNDIPLILRHFQEVIEKGESKSAVYRFCLHDDVYAFVNTQSKFFSNSPSGTSDSIMSTHTIVRLIDNINDLNGTASTRLMKSIISSNRDLQKGRQQSTSKLLPPTPTSTSPIGTQFALTMLGMYKNPSNSLQQHVSNTLGTLLHVQHSLSTPTANSNETTAQQTHISSPLRSLPQKPPIFDNVSSSETVEFGSKRAPFSPSFIPASSNHGTVPSPINSLDLFFASISPSDDLSGLLPTAPTKSSSPKSIPESNLSSFPSNDVYSTVTNNSSRSSLRLRQLLTTKSPPSTTSSPSQSLHYQHEIKSHSNTFDDPTQHADSPSTTHQSPSSIELSSPNRRRQKLSPTNGISTSTPQSTDVLLKQILGRQPPITSSVSLPNASDTPENHNYTWSSPTSVPSGKPESNTNDENTEDGQTTTINGANHKLRSDTFLRTLLNDEVRPQKVVVETPFSYGTRDKTNQRASGGADLLVGLTRNKSSVSPPSQPLKGQLSFDNNDSSTFDHKSKKKPRQNSHTFGSRTNTMTTVTLPRKPGRPKRDSSDYLFFNPQSTLSDNSLDSFFDQTTSQSSPIVLPPTTPKSTPNLKRLADHEDSSAIARKLPKLLKDEVKIEYTDHAVIPPSISRPVHHSSVSIIKSEPETFDSHSSCDKTSSKRLPTNPSSSASHAPLLRSLICTSQTTGKDAPLYDLLQNLDANDTSKKPTLEQYLSPAVSRIPPSKDDYLAALLSADPQQPSEISFVPVRHQQKLVRSASNSSESSRIAAIVTDLFNSTTAVPPVTNVHEDFLSLLDNKDFLECLTDSSTIDSILSENATNAIQTSFRSNGPKHSEKDEKAISEIYKTLVTSFNPGPSALDRPVNDSSFNSLAGEILFPETNPHSVVNTRTVNMDPYRQQSNTYSYPIAHQQSSSNTPQFSDCLSMDLMDNTSAFPPNVSLSSMTNTFLPSTHMENQSLMMYSQQTPPSHIHHHQPAAHFFRQPSQAQQATMYNNYNPPANQVAPGYYAIAPQRMSQSSPGNQRAPSNHSQQRIHMSANPNLSRMQSNQQQQQQRPMMNTYNDLMMPNNTGSQDFHQYSSPLMTNNSLDMFLSPSSSPQRHGNVMQQQPPVSQATMHQSYSTMNVAPSGSIPQHNSHNPNNLMNPPMANLTPMECRQSDELNNQIMNSLSFPPARCTHDSIRKQLQTVIHGRQKSGGGKEIPVGGTGQKMMNSGNLDPNQKGGYFRSRLSSPLPTSPLQTTIRSQQHQQQQQQQNKSTM